MKTAYLIETNTDPIRFGFGKWDGYANACEAWEGFAEGDEFLVIASTATSPDGDALGKGVVIGPVKANVIAFDFIPGTETALGAPIVAEVRAARLKHHPVFAGFTPEVREAIARAACKS